MESQYTFEQVGEGTSGCNQKAIKNSTKSGGYKTIKE